MPRLSVQQLAEVNEFMNAIVEFWTFYFEADVLRTDGAWRKLLSTILQALVMRLQTTRVETVGPEYVRRLVEAVNLKELDKWKNLVESCLRQETWDNLIYHPIIQPDPRDDAAAFWQTNRRGIDNLLRRAFRTEYLGEAVERFIERLEQLNTEDLFAKVITVVQSSGTGKSRMLTEVGKYLFTLPITLRGEGTPGYPVGDWKVHDSFERFQNKGDRNFSTRASRYIASFLSAAYQTMLRCLQDWCFYDQLTGDKLRDEWHLRMEMEESREFRQDFFTEVLKTAEELDRNMESASPKRTANRLKLYSDYVERSAKELMEFIHQHSNPEAICVTYFDGAHNLGNSRSIMTHLLSQQDSSLPMWYAFLGTEPEISQYTPQYRDQHPQNETPILPSFIYLGFDQHMIYVDRPFPSSISEVQTIAHLCNYGRPMWKAQYPLGDERESIGTAAMKLTCVDRFDPRDKNHVFAVLSHRLCLDAPLYPSEAQDLAGRSVERHMRLLLGFSPDKKTISTCSSSEPLLTLGACELLYTMPYSAPSGSDEPLDPTPSHWPEVLRTLRNLCTDGLVENGLLGELAIRTLLTIARDFAAPKIPPHRTSIPDLLQLVPLLDVLDKLFGKNLQSDAGFREAFAPACVNYTHWAITKHPLPEDPDMKLLANLWFRGVALQYCFIEELESLELLIPVYFGSVDPDDKFFPSKLSALVLRVTYEIEVDTGARATLKPIGLLHDSRRSFPHLVLLWELRPKLDNSEKYFQLTPPDAVNLKDIEKEYIRAKAELEEHNKMPKQRDPKDFEDLKKKVEESKKAKDNYNRYNLTVRGVLPELCAILEEAKIKTAFASFFGAILPPYGTLDNKYLRQMRPSERLAASSAHTAWFMGPILEPKDGDDDESISDLEEDTMTEETMDVVDSCK